MEFYTCGLSWYTNKTCPDCNKNKDEEYINDTDTSNGYSNTTNSDIN